MGYCSRDGDLAFEPDNTKDELFICMSCSITPTQLIGKIKQHFGEHISLDDIDISAENIRTNCLTYDRYDPTDWTKYLVISRVN